MRVQKYMSQAGAASRRQAEAMIREGRVAINGEAVSAVGARVIPGMDVVSLDGRVVEPAPRRWIVFHKPVGVLCTRTDPHGGRTVYDLLPPWAGGLRYVGRLDRDTSGLLLMTNEGDLAAALAHPSGRVEREYRARIAARLSSRTLKRLKRGVQLEDGFARPVRVRRFDWGEDEPGCPDCAHRGQKARGSPAPQGRGPPSAVPGADAVRSVSAGRAETRSLETCSALRVGRGKIPCRAVAESPPERTQEKGRTACLTPRWK